MLTGTCAVDPSLELQQIVFQQRDAIFYGAEAGAQLDVGRVWRGTWGIDGQYDFVRATFDDRPAATCPASRRIAPVPACTTATPAGSRASACCTPSTRMRSARARRPTKGYTLLNADLAYTLKLDPLAGAATEMTVGLKGENLLDDDVRNHVSFKKDEVLQPGRTVRLYGIVKLN